MGIEKINHIIWIIQENRTFDNYFGTFPGADGFSPDICLPVLPGSKDCVKPFHMPAGAPYCDIDHSWAVAHAACDNGKMDGFVWAEGSPYTIGYYDDRDIPNYWVYARHFVLCDAFFSSLNGPSLPNHVYTVAAQSGGIVDNPTTVKAVEEELDDPDGFTFASMVDLFEKARLSPFWCQRAASRTRCRRIACTRLHSRSRRLITSGLWMDTPGFRGFGDERRDHSRVGDDLDAEAGIFGLSRGE